MVLPGNGDSAKNFKATTFFWESYLDFFFGGG